jgi:hypothetical protein
MRAMFSCSAPFLFWILAQPSLAKPPAPAPCDMRRAMCDVQSVEKTDAFGMRAAPRAQSGKNAPNSGREYFVSWGYNADNYTKSDLHITQPSLGNDFTLVAVRARDSKPWDQIFGHALTVPQYNFRFGIFFNERWGLEVAHDHFKWIVRQDQEVRMTGTLNGSAVNTQVRLTPEVLRYQLNNGANPLFVNVIRRVKLRGEPKRTGYVAFLAKAGGGFANPHTENAVFDQPNEKGFQFFKGWNVDAVAAVRLNFFKRLYVEVEDKLVYVRYFGLKVDRGTARQSVKVNEFTVSAGIAFK